MTEQRVSDERLARIIRNGELLSSLDADWKAAQDGMAIVRDLIDARAEAARLRAVLIEAQESIDYGTRAGGAAEVLAHIATVLKGDGHATVERGSEGGDATHETERDERPGRNAVTGAAHPNNADESWAQDCARHEAVQKSLRVLRDGYNGRSQRGIVEACMKAASEAFSTTIERTGDESWQARRAELLWRIGYEGKGPDAIAAALDRAFEFGRGMR